MSVCTTHKEYLWAAYERYYLIVYEHKPTIWWLGDEMGSCGFCGGIKRHEKVIKTEWKNKCNTQTNTQAHTGRMAKRKINYLIFITIWHCFIYTEIFNFLLLTLNYPSRHDYRSGSQRYLRQNFHPHSSSPFFLFLYIFHHTQESCDVKNLNVPCFSQWKFFTWSVHCASQHYKNSKIQHDGGSTKKRGKIRLCTRKQQQGHR